VWRYGVEETRRARAYGSRMCTVMGMQSHSGGGVMNVEREAKRACGLGKREEMEMGKRGLRRFNFPMSTRQEPAMQGQG